MKNFCHGLGIIAVLLIMAACSSAPPGGSTSSARAPVEHAPPLQIIHSVAGINIGEPLAVFVDFDGNLLVADGSPGRVLRIDPNDPHALEFQQPDPAFYPSDLTQAGFFVYAIDKVGRGLLRFDKDGAYRDQLVNFDERFAGEQVSPMSLAIDPQGRIAVSDVRNHQIIIFDSFFNVELTFGTYGTFPGQLNAPEGLSFSHSGELIVADAGNRRVQILDSSGGFVRQVPDDPSQANPLMKPRRANVTRDGTLFVADPVAGAVFVYDSAGKLLRTLAPDGVEGFRPSDVAVTSTGLIYVADLDTSSIYTFR